MLASDEQAGRIDAPQVCARYLRESQANGWQSMFALAVATDPAKRWLDERTRERAQDELLTRAGKAERVHTLGVCASRIRWCVARVSEAARLLTGAPQADTTAASADVRTRFERV
jgi:hypothetical protein